MAAQARACWRGAPRFRALTSLIARATAGPRNSAERALEPRGGRGVGQDEGRVDGAARVPRALDGHAAHRERRGLRARQDGPAAAREARRGLHRPGPRPRRLRLPRSGDRGLFGHAETCKNKTSEVYASVSTRVLDITDKVSETVETVKTSVKEKVGLAKAPEEETEEPTEEPSRASL